jgi:uridine kinase
VLLKESLSEAKQGNGALQPIFDPVEGRRSSVKRLPHAPLLIADGEICAHDTLAHLWDQLILVQAHWRTQLQTRLSRDLKERHCSVEKALNLFLESNCKDYPCFAANAPSRARCILYRNARNRFRIIQTVPNATART